MRKLIRRRMPFAVRSRGIAIVMVIVILAGLTALLAPFAFSMVMHGRVARSDLDAAQAKAGAEAAVNHGLAHLHSLIKAPGFDPTPEWDSIDELQVPMAFTGADADFQDPNGIMWSAKIEDEQGKVNLHTAPPNLIGNLLYSTTLTESVGAGATALLVDDPDAFPCDDNPQTPDGFVRIGGDTVRYVDVNGNTIVLAPAGGYAITRGHRQGALVYDGRGGFIADYKFRVGAAEFRPFRSIYEIKAISALSDPTLAIRPDEFARIERHMTIHSSLDGPAWGAAGRISEQSFEGDRQTFTVENDSGFGPGTLVRFFQAGKTITYGRVEGVRVSLRNGRQAFVQLEEPVGVSASGSGVGNDVYMTAEMCHPINVNTAPPEVLAACFTGVALAATSESVQRQQALILAQLLKYNNRVYRNSDDLKSALDDAHTRGVLSAGLRDAVFINATEYNSPKLRSATVPFVYRALGSFTIEGSGVVNAKNGVPLARHSQRQTVTLPTPPPGKFKLGTQEEFQRLIDQGQGQRVVTWPIAMEPESKRFRRLGFVRQPDDRDGDIRLSVGETGDAGAQGGSQGQRRRRNQGGDVWVEHCDNPEDPGYFQEGFDLSKREAWVLDPPNANAGNNNNPRTAPGGVELWYKPFRAGNVTFFDQGQEAERNRVHFGYDPARGLVIKIWDANLDGKFVEYLYPYQMEGATWTHVAGSWRSGLPGGQEVRIDANPNAPGGEMQFKPGSRLAMNLNFDEVDSLEVEDAADFPDAGAVRIGEEIVEYFERAGSTLKMLRRGARMSAAVDHLEGEFVIPYGFIVGLGQDLVVGGSTLSENLEADSKLRTRILNPPPKPDIPATETGKITVLDASAFPPSGYLNVNGEFIYYGSKTATTFQKLKRGQRGTDPHDLRHNQGVHLLSLQASGPGDYPRSGYVQIEDENDEYKVEWIEYGTIESEDSKTYFVPHLNVGAQGGDPRRRILSTGGFRGQWGTNANMVHTKKAKLIPVVRMEGPHAGDQSSPYGPEASGVTLMERGQPDGEKRFIKRAVINQHPNVNNRGAFIDWGFDYLVGLDDFASRTYGRQNGILLRFPTGELPEIADRQRYVCQGMSGDGKVDGYVDEVKVMVSRAEGGKIAMDTVATGLGSGDTELPVEHISGWARPGGQNIALGTWPRAGLLRIGDELIYYDGQSTGQVNYYADVLPRVEQKATRQWNNQLHPNNNNENKNVLILQNLKRGLFGTKAQYHPPGTGVMVYDGAPFTVLRGNIGPLDDRFEVTDGAQFPAEGYAWIDNEVLSWTKGGGTSFEGCRVFRGRFGTNPESHQDGALVRCLPFRYWDRHAFQFDGAGLAYFQCGYAAKDAIWETVDLTTKGGGGDPLPQFVRPHVLVRFDGRPAWDSQPTNQEGGLYEFRGAGIHKLTGFAARGGVRADQIEIRVFWKFESRAFQPGQDWKRTFALDEIKATYYSPLVFRRLEEVEQR
ncbi:MAG: hypothetical protein HS116_25610 [Planctomycetes bacterium]|nr:hypothetical protein [Planctomycetota bacterium]